MLTCAGRKFGVWCADEHEWTGAEGERWGRRGGGNGARGGASGAILSELLGGVEGEPVQVEL